MSDQSVVMLQEEVKKMIRYDLSTTGGVSQETEEMALAVFTPKEYQQVVVQENAKVTGGVHD